MSLLKSLTGLAKATYELAKEDKEFRKEYAIATVTYPIVVGKYAFDLFDSYFRNDFFEVFSSFCCFI